MENRKTREIGAGKARDIASPKKETIIKKTTNLQVAKLENSDKSTTGNIGSKTSVRNGVNPIRSKSLKTDTDSFAYRTSNGVNQKPAEAGLVDSNVTRESELPSTNMIA